MDAYDPWSSEDFSSRLDKFDTGQLEAMVAVVLSATGTDLWRWRLRRARQVVVGVDSVAPQAVKLLSMSLTTG